MAFLNLFIFLILIPLSGFIAQTNIYSNFTPQWCFLNYATATYSQVTGDDCRNTDCIYHGEWRRGQNGHIFLDVLGWLLWFKAWCNRSGLLPAALYSVRCRNSSSSSHHNAAAFGRRQNRQLYGFLSRIRSKSKMWHSLRVKHQVYLDYSQHQESGWLRVEQNKFQSLRFQNTIIGGQTGSESKIRQRFSPQIPKYQICWVRVRQKNKKKPFCRSHAPQLQPELWELGTAITNYQIMNSVITKKNYRKVNKGLKPRSFSLIKLSSVQQKLICVFLPNNCKHFPRQ